MYKDHETPQFWITYQDAIRKYLSKRVSDKSVVDDLCHDVYIRIFCYCRRFDFCCDKAGVKNLRSWVFQVCHNILADHYRKHKTSFTIENIETIGILIDSPGEHYEIPVENLLQKIPSKYALPVHYDMILGIKQADIASKLGLSVSATKSRIQRGKKMLATAYHKNYSL